MDRISTIACLFFCILAANASAGMNEFESCDAKTDWQQKVIRNKTCCRNANSLSSSSSTTAGIAEKCGCTTSVQMSSCKVSVLTIASV